MHWPWLTLAIAATVAYHLVLKLTPVGVNPWLSLMVTYALVAVVFGAMFLLSPGDGGWREELGRLNWTAPALAIAIVGLDLGFMLLYRSGFEVSLGALVTQTAAGLLLLVVGIAFFSEKLSLTNVAGLVLCVVGLWLVHRR